MAGTAPFAFTLMLLVLSSIYTRSSAKPSAGPAETALGGGHRTRARSLTMFYSPARRYVRPLEQDVLDDDDELAMDAAKGKRQFDDYGHLRFGKRGDDQFDDYGHMRFGRSLDK